MDNEILVGIKVFSIMYFHNKKVQNVNGVPIDGQGNPKLNQAIEE